jgi:hypothetical protein
VKLVEGDPASSEAITKLGFDPLLELPSLQQFAAALAARAKGAARLKPLLLDQVGCRSSDMVPCRAAQDATMFESMQGAVVDMSIVLSPLPAAYTQM